MQKIKILILLLLPFTAFGQLAQGPANGSVSTGVTINTNNFLMNRGGDKISPMVKMPRNKIPYKPTSSEFNVTAPTAPEGSNLFPDNTVAKIDRGSETDEPVLLKKFQAFLDPGGYIPPDPYAAAGPMHVVACDNGRIRIWDKEGNMLKTIDGDVWCNAALPGASAFDPKISYDNISKRWIMVWLHQSDSPARSYYIISVSKDSSAIGEWHEWALPSNTTGNTQVNNWGDYQGVGYDDQAIYLTSNQFQFGGNFQGSKIRILKKSEMYAAAVGAVTWTDFWDIREPANTNTRTFGVRPAVMHSTSSAYYLTAQCPYTPGTFFVLYKITNPVTNPQLSAVNVPVTSYNSPPGANQLGGGSPTLETGGSGIVNEPKFRNGFLWVVHAIRAGTGNAYAAVRYVKINTATNTAIEDGAMGVDGYWYFYPAIEVDKDMNVAITYSRSSVNEYAGAFYTTRLNTDPPNTLIGSRTLQEGKANYVKTFGSGRNRWGDYMGIWLDPVDQNSVWMATEYTETPAHTWAVMMGQVRLLPYQTARIFTYVDSLNFGTREVQTTSDTMKFNIYNFGSDTLRITNLSNGSPQFQITSSFTYPVKIKFNDSVTVKYVYKPTTTGNTLDTLKISSNDPVSPVRNFYLKGRGYVINPAVAGVIYGVTGTQASGVLLNINRNSGTAFSIGSTSYNALDGVSIKPSNRQIYAVYQNSTLVRLNATAGDGYPRTAMKITNVRGIAFDTNDDLYAATVDGKIYKVNSTNGDTIFVGNSAVTNLYSLAINPLTGQLWGITISSQLYKINKSNGAATTVATVNQPFTASIAFNHLGRLIGISGVSNQTGKLISIDTTTGNGTLIGTSTGFSGINGIAISSETVGISEVPGTIVPKEFALMQNYPNPFNPVTKIQFNVPAGYNGNVNISVFDMTGKLISQLVNQNLAPGTYEADWNASGFASGVYYYKMTGNNFSDVKRMVLVK
jgi:hypothetical protein